MNGDFSYKFPLRGVPEYQRNINVMLNSLVSHIEKLSEEARQRERFLNNVINRVEVGIIVANSRRACDVCQQRRLEDALRA